MVGIRYTGTFSDHSGYGSANRAYITALYTAGVDVTTELVVQVVERAEHGWTGDLCTSLMDRTIDYPIKVIHLTPDMYPRYMEKGKYHIGHLFWETDRLPQEWIEPINKMQEIWTSSEAMAALFRNCGVKVPIYAFPQPIDISETDQPREKFDLPEHKGFLFYAVFQWIERKNPKALLQAYWEAFSGRQDVSLLLKTYRVGYGDDEYQRILLDIERWKRETNLGHFPRVLLVTKLLSHAGMMQLHYTGDAYLSADHGEGWSRPLEEALLMGKPAITTARGGIHEYLDQSMYFPIKSTYVPVVEQPWIPWYSSDQNWAQIDKQDFKKQMKAVFLNKTAANIKGYKAKEFVKSQFSYQVVGDAMKKRLEKIVKTL
jgi:glycosyltransferase involved in cell wall biosynthesis